METTKKRVLVSTYITPSLFTGVGRYVLELLKELENRDDILLTIAASSDLKKRIEVELTKQHQWVNWEIFEGNRILARLHYYWKQWRFQQKNEYDELWVPNTVPVFKGKIPVRITVHDLAEFDTQTYSYWNRCLRRWFIHLIIKNVNEIVVVSAFTKQRLLHYFPNIETKVLVKAPHLFYLEQIQANVSVIQKWGFQIEAYNVYIGRFAKNKQVDLLIKAYKKAIDLNKEVIPLLLIGIENNESLWLKNMIHQLSLDKWIHFTGYVSEEDKFGLIKQAKHVLFPSLYEGFGFPVYESLAMNTKCVLFNLPVYKDLTNHLLQKIDDTNVESWISYIEKSPQIGT